MCRQLIENYLLLSQEDLHVWETNPEEFGIIKIVLAYFLFIFFSYTKNFCFSSLAAEEGGEAWKYSLRVCTEMLKW